MARRPNGTPTRTVSVSLLEASYKQLSLEALARGTTVHAYVRELLETYAPGITPIQDLAKKLAATPISPLDKTA